MFVKLKTALLCATVLAATIPSFIAPAHAAVPALPAALPLITGAIDEASLTTLTGNHAGALARVQDQGVLDGAHVLTHVTIGLKRPAALQAAFDRLVSEQTRPGSANYMNWLTAADLRRFSPAQSDIDQVAAWLKSHNLTVNTVSPSGMSIDAAGRTQDFAVAFHTSLHNVSLNGEAHIANMTDPAIPTALTPVLRGITLSNFFGKPALAPARPQFTVPALPATPALYLVAPADLATIYNLNGAFDGLGTPFGYVIGKGVTIAVLERSDVRTKDITRFRDYFGLSQYPGTFKEIHPGQCQDPGYDGEENEAAVDSEWAGAGAPGADIIAAACANTELTFGIEVGLQNLVELAETRATIYSVSYSAFENQADQAFLSGWANLLEEGAAQGISIMISSGDTGPGNGGGRDFEGLAVNGLASTEYATAVGGTDFSDYVHGQTATYWRKGNQAPGRASVKSYVPEIPWNDSCAGSVTAKFEANQTGMAYCNGGAEGHNIVDGQGASGGQSVVYAKPDWQLTNVLGMPNDKGRDLPDVSLFAGDGVWNHAYLYCMSDEDQGGAKCKYTGNISGIPWAEFSASGGTSFSTPAFAGIMALVSSANKHRLGNVAPRLYQLAAAQYSNPLLVHSCNSSLGNAISTACVFNNITTGDIAQPCVAGSPNCYVNALSTNGTGILSASTGKTEVNAYPAHPGYSLATGLGSLNVGNLVSDY